jgi:hypothetical protein
MIHPLFDRWFGIKVGESDEYSAPRKRDELICLTDKARRELKPKSLNELMGKVGAERIEKARKKLAGKSPAERRQVLRDEWTALLGPVSSGKPPIVKAQSTDEQAVAGARVERVVLEVEPGIVVPVLLLSPEKVSGRAPAVVCLAQTGKAGFLKERAGELEKLVRGGTIVVLPDLRGTGESRSGSPHGPGGSDLSVHLQLFGETLLGERLRDLRSVLAYLRERKDIGKRLALWGDSFAPTNPPETNFKVPRGVEGWPRESEPLGGLLALLGGLFEEDVRAVYLAGGLASYHAVLGHFAVLIPHGSSLPGALTAGDLCDLAGGLAPRPLRLEAMVDAMNRPLPADAVKKAYDPAVRGYSATPQALSFADRPSSAAAWLLGQLK